MAYKFLGSSFQSYSTRGASYQADQYGVVTVPTPTNQDISDLLNAGLVSLGSVQAKSNYSATVDPTAGNDNTQDYGPGSHWINSTNGRVWICQTAVTGAAAWALACVPGTGTFPLINLGSSGIITPNPAAFFPSAVTNNAGAALSALQFTGGLLTRTGPTAAFTDTVPTAAQMFAVLGSEFPVGTSAGNFYLNSTPYAVTLATNTGVTISPAITIPPYSSAYYQIAFTSATAATVTLVATLGTFLSLPNVLVGTADNGTTQTLTTAMVAGGVTTAHMSAGGSAPSLTMPTAAAIIAAITGFGVGDSYLLRVINANSGTATMVTNTGITTTGTLTLATNTTRDFAITMTGAATLSMVSVGTGTYS